MSARAKAAPSSLKARASRATALCVAALCVAAPCAGASFASSCTAREDPRDVGARPSGEIPAEERAAKAPPEPLSSWIDLEDDILVGYVADFAARLPDGRILVVVERDRSEGGFVSMIAIALRDGALDESFVPLELGGYLRSAIALEDGSVVVGGDFDEIGGRKANGIARLLPDGSVDASWRADPGTDAVVKALLPLSNGKLLVGGEFTTMNGEPRSCLALLERDGALADRLGPAAAAESGIVNPEYPTAINCFLELPGGDILVGGSFDRIGGVDAFDLAILDSRLERMRSVAVPDLVRADDNEVYAMERHADGSIWVAGLFLRNDGSWFRILVLDPRSGSSRFILPGRQWAYALAAAEDGSMFVCVYKSIDKDPFAGSLVRVRQDGNVLAESPGEDLVRGVFNFLDPVPALSGGFWGCEGLPDGTVLAWPPLLRFEMDLSIDPGFRTYGLSRFLDR